ANRSEHPVIGQVGAVWFPRGTEVYQIISPSPTSRCLRFMTTPANPPLQPAQDPSAPVAREQVYWAAAFLLLLLLSACWTFLHTKDWWDNYLATDTPLRPDGYPQAADFAQYVAVARAWETGTIDQIYDLDHQDKLVREITGQAPDAKPAYDTRLLTFSYP